MEIAVRGTEGARKGTFAAAFGRGWGTWWRHLGQLAQVAAVVWVPAYAVQLALGLALDVPGRTRAVTAAARAGSADLGSASALGVYALVSILILVVAVPLSHGALIAAVGCYERGAPCRISDCYRLARERFWPFLGAVVLVALLIVLAEGVLVTVAVLLMRIAGGNVAFLLLLVVVGAVLPLLLAVPFTLAPQAVVLEHAPVLDALQRSRRLIGGRYLTTLLLLIALGAIGWIASLVAGLPAHALSAGGTSVQMAANAGAAMVMAVLMAPLVIAVLTALYFEVRE